MKKKKKTEVLNVTKDNTKGAFEALYLILVCSVPESGIYNLNKP